jgi:hypothetical protein
MTTPQEYRSRAGKPGATAKPISVRLTDDERRQLAERAGERPLATFIRDLALDRASQSRRQRGVGRIEDKDALARVLSTLGHSDLSNTLGQLAKAAHTGTLLLTPETENKLHAAIDAIKDMRRALMRALGISDGDSA